MLWHQQYLQHYPPYCSYVTIHINLHKWEDRHQIPNWLANSKPNWLWVSNSIGGFQIQGLHGGGDHKCGIPSIGRATNPPCVLLLSRSFKNSYSTRLLITDLYAVGCYGLAAFMLCLIVMHSIVLMWYWIWCILYVMLFQHLNVCCLTELCFEGQLEMKQNNQVHLQPKEWTVSAFTSMDRLLKVN